MASLVLPVVRSAVSVSGHIASSAFAIASTSTSFGFTVVQSLLAIPTGGQPNIITNVVDVSHQIAQLGISVGRYITLSSLSIAQSGIDAVSAPSEGETLRSLSMFANLVRREWGHDHPSGPEGGISGFGYWQVLRAITTWSMLQSITQPYFSDDIIQQLEVVDPATWARKVAGCDTPLDSEDVALQDETIHTATTNNDESVDILTGEIRGLPHAHGSNKIEEIQNRVKRYAKICLGSYGGIGLVFFGVPIPQLSRHKSRRDGSVKSKIVDEQSKKAERKIARRLSEVVLVEPHDSSASDHESVAAQSPEPEETFSMWDLITGKHDLTVLERLGGLEPGSLRDGPVQDHDFSEDEMEDYSRSPSPSSDSSSYSSSSPSMRGKDRFKKSSSSGVTRRSPRYFIITDHPNRSVVVCIRGTLSLDDVATDLTCSETRFDAEEFWDDEVDYCNLDFGFQQQSHVTETQFSVHEGFYEVARNMGGFDGPVTESVRRALAKSKCSGYEVLVIGHSLGAGIGTLLALTWADPRTGLTTVKGGLPPGTRVKVYGFASPCSTCASLSHLSRSMITSFTYSIDIVTRLSLGHVRDLRTAASWLSYLDTQPEERLGGRRMQNVLREVVEYAAKIQFQGNSNHSMVGSGHFDQDALNIDLDWLVALRKTLEANMNSATLFPPGEVYWVVEPSDIELPNDVTHPPQGRRLLRVTGDVSKVFRQIIFGRTMLSSHLPQRYASCIDEIM